MKRGLTGKNSTERSRAFRETKRRRFKKFYIMLLILYWKPEADPGAGKRLKVFFIEGYWGMKEEQAWPHGGELKIIDNRGVRGADVMR